MAKQTKKGKALAATVEPGQGGGAIDMGSGSGAAGWAAAIRAPARASPRSEATATIWARRGDSGIFVSRIPCFDNPPSACSAPNRLSTLRASAIAPAGGGSSRMMSNWSAIVSTPSRRRSRMKVGSRAIRAANSYSAS